MNARIVRPSSASVGGSTAALLQKASAQLKGERINNANDNSKDTELEARLCFLKDSLHIGLSMGLLTIFLSLLKCQ